jgi:hypothetical protein
MKCLDQLVSTFMTSPNSCFSSIRNSSVPKVLTELSKKCCPRLGPHQNVLLGETSL